jgi:iron complex outermembrane recepter protein
MAAEPQSTSQPAKSDELTEIVVSGYRLSLETALANKRNSDLPIESVSQEDIGKMPDQNVAETLQRLPGIQIDRSGQNGQGTSVLIDGLRQNLTTLNGDIFLSGKEFYVSGEASGGGAGSNSQYSSLETIPSELVSGIDVIKNPNAAITEGGMGGTINLKTMDPLAVPAGLSLAGVANESKAESTDTATPNGVLIGSYKVNDSLAFTASVGYDKELTHTKEYQDANRNAWIDTDSAVGPYTGPLQPADITRLSKYYIDPQLGYFSDIEDQRVQNAASVGFAWKITDSLTTNFNWLYAREDESTYTYSDKTWFNGQGASSGSLLPGINPTLPYSIDPNGVVQQGTFNANGAETASLYQDDITEANNFQWVTKFDNGGPLRGLFDGAFSRATGNLQAAQADIEHGLYNTSSGVATSPAAPGCNNGASTCAPGTGTHGYQFTYNNGGSSGLPSVSYLPPYADILNNPAYATFKSNWAWANYTYQKDWSVKAEGQYDVPFVTEVKMTITGGVRYANRQVDETFGRYLINGTLANGDIAGNANGPTPNNPGAGFGPWLYYQDPGYGKPNIPYSTATSNPGLVATYPNFAVGNIIVKNPTTGGLNNPATYLEKVWAGAGVPNMTEQFFKDGLSSFEVEETTTAPYLMLDIGAPSSRFHANFGVRLVDTDLTINNGASAKVPTYYGTASWNGVDSNVVPVTTKRNYTDVLPSFNFMLDVTDTQIVRFSAARVVAPQDLYQLGLGNTYGYTRQVGNRVNVKTGLKDGFYFNGGSSGNAELDPYRASQFLLAYENYFAPGAVASVGGFYKQVDNFVEVESIPTFVNDDFGGTTSNVTEPVNAGNARIYGLEFGSQYAFGDAVAWLKGFGFRANYTYSQSQSNQPTSFSTRGPIPGVSQNSATGTLYYENHGFSVRGSYSWRSKSINDSVVGSTFSFANQAGVQKTYQVFAAPYGQLDMQASYDFNSHIGVLVSVQNLTDEKQRTYLQWPDLPFTYDDWGKRYFVGIKGKL